MAVPLLATKLHRPRRRRGLVPRPRLSARLTASDEPALVLVSAPAGFGKTTLLTEWLAATETDGRAVAWLSLDSRDDDPTAFWTYVVAALRAAVPDVGSAAMELLRTQQPSVEAVLATLFDDLSTVPGDVVLVLDDYHVIESRAVQDGVAFLLEHLPPQLHLVLATRVDPALPLARLRGRGELVELRAADLRFSSEEVATYLGDVMGLDLTAADLAALEGRTEGWIAALQLAALSLQGRDDVAGFVATFAGDDRFVVDYLVEEVLQRQPEGVRSFLLETSLLTRLTGPLCDAVTGTDGGRATLEALERANLFLVPLDDRRQWYRYHHLFGDVLRARLLDERPGQVRALHLRAVDWYERNGEPGEAISHALAGGDVERAAALVERELPALRQSRQEVTLRRWLDQLPDDLLRVRPVLNIGYVGALMSVGEIEGVERRLQDAERWLDPASVTGDRAAEFVVVDDDGFRRLPTEIAMYRAALALLGGDVEATMRHARRALGLAGTDDHLGHGAAACLLGLACWTTGDLETAHRWYSEGTASLARAGHEADVLGGLVTLADLRVEQGRLRDAMSHYERGLRTAADSQRPALRGSADMHVGMSDLLRKRDDLVGARRHLDLGSELGDAAGLPQNRYRWRVGMAWLHEFDRDHDGALRLLEEAERVYTTDFSPGVRPIPAIRTRLWLMQGRLDEARGWVRDRGLSPDDEPSYLREYEHITLARVLLAEHATTRSQESLAAASGLLDRLLRAAEDGGRTGAVIEILVLSALAHRAGGNVPAALAALRRAVVLAEPEGYVRVFADEGPPMGALLRSLAQDGVSPPYVRRLLAAVRRPGVDLPQQRGLVDPLSDREIEVLRMLGTHLDGPEIARRLFVSVNTLRTHTKNIYAKLGVNGRGDAVSRATELELI